MDDIRSKGTFAIKNFEIEQLAPIDSRTYVDNVEHLTDVTWWNEAALFPGLTVTYKKTDNTFGIAILCERPSNGAVPDGALTAAFKYQNKGNPEKYFYWMEVSGSEGEGLGLYKPSSSVSDEAVITHDGGVQGYKKEDFGDGITYNKLMDLILFPSTCPQITLPEIQTTDLDLTDTDKYWGAILKQETYGKTGTENYVFKEGTILPTYLDHSFGAVDTTTDGNYDWKLTGYKTNAHQTSQTDGSILYYIPKSATNLNSSISLHYGLGTVLYDSNGAAIVDETSQFYNSVKQYYATKNGVVLKYIKDANGNLVEDADGEPRLASTTLTKTLTSITPINPQFKVYKKPTLVATNSKKLVQGTILPTAITTENASDYFTYIAGAAVKPDGTSEVLFSNYKTITNEYLDSNNELIWYSDSACQNVITDRQMPVTGYAYTKIHVSFAADGVVKDAQDRNITTYNSWIVPVENDGFTNYTSVAYPNGGTASTVFGLTTNQSYLTAFCTQQSDGSYKYKGGDTATIVISISKSELEDVDFTYPTISGFQLSRSFGDSISDITSAFINEGTSYYLTNSNLIKTFTFNSVNYNLVVTPTKYNGVSKNIIQTYSASNHYKISVDSIKTADNNSYSLDTMPKQNVIVTFKLEFGYGEQLDINGLVITPSNKDKFPSIAQYLTEKTIGTTNQMRVKGSEDLTDSITCQVVINYTDVSLPTVTLPTSANASITKPTIYMGDLFTIPNFNVVANRYMLLTYGNVLLGTKTQTSNPYTITLGNVSIVPQKLVNGAYVNDASANVYKNETNEDGTFKTYSNSDKINISGKQIILTAPAYKFTWAGTFTSTTQLKDANGKIIQYGDAREGDAAFDAVLTYLNSSNVLKNVATITFSQVYTVTSNNPTVTITSYNDPAVKVIDAVEVGSIISGTANTPTLKNSATQGVVGLYKDISTTTTANYVEVLTGISGNLTISATASKANETGTLSNIYQKIKINDEFIDTFTDLNKYAFKSKSSTGTTASTQVYIPYSRVENIPELKTIFSSYFNAKVDSLSSYKTAITVSWSCASFYYKQLVITSRTILTADDFAAIRSNDSRVKGKNATSVGDLTVNSGTSKYQYCLIQNNSNSTAVHVTTLNFGSIGVIEDYTEAQTLNVSTSDTILQYVPTVKLLTEAGNEASNYSIFGYHTDGQTNWSTTSSMTFVKND